MTSHSEAVTPTTPLELAHAAYTAMVAQERAISLTFPKGRVPRRFPRGKVVGTTVHPPTITAHYRPAQVLEWLMRYKMVTVTRTGPLSYHFTSK
jgi:hypothetical protein